MSEEQELVAAGKLGKAFGVQGKIKLFSYIKPGELQTIPRFFIQHKTMGLVELNLSDLRPHGKGFVVGFSGVNTPEAARELAGHYLLVRQDDLPQLLDGEFYAFQLVGKKLLDPAGQELGIIQDIVQVPGYFLIQADTLSVPFTKRFIKEITQQGVVLRTTELPG